MGLDYTKLFKGMRSKAAGAYTIEELGHIFSGQTGLWNKKNELEQYSKSLYVFAAVNKIAVKIAAIDYELFRITNKAGDTKRIANHQILDTLAKPNAFQTKNEFLKITWINKKLTGEAFWLKIRNSSGKVIEVWNLRPDYMTVVSDPTKYISHYELMKTTGGIEKFAPEDIIHFKDPDPLNQFRGMSPIGVAKMRIETEQSAALFQRDFFRNNARPDALLITPETLDTEQRAQMTSAWDEEHQGRKNNSKIGILEGGMTYQQVSISQREMDYIESSKFTRDDILVALGVPKAMVTADDINYANAETGLHVFLSETIVPEMEQLVETINEMLISPDFGEEFYIDFRDPTPSDRDSLRADHTVGFGRWLTTNEIRADYGLEPLPGGDVIAQPVGVGAGGASGSDKPAAPPSGDTPSGDLPTKKFGKTRTYWEDRQRNIAQRRLQGRPMLRMRFEVAEEVLKEIESQKDSIAKQIKEKAAAAKIKKAAPKKSNITADTIVKVRKSRKTADAKKEIKYRSIFTEKTVRKQYEDLINKRIDTRAVPFERALVSEFAKQKVRVEEKLAELEQHKGLPKEKLEHVDIAALLNKAGEIKAFASLALPFLENFAQQGGKDAGNMTGEVYNMSANLTTNLTKKAHIFAETITETTFKALTSTLSDGISAGEGITDLSKRVSDVYGQIPDWRASTIARTETTYANNAGMLDQFQSSDVVNGKEWIATLDDRTRETHAQQDGEIVAVEDTFSDGLMYPGDESGDPDEVINCRCVMAPALFD